MRNNPYEPTRLREARTALSHTEEAVRSIMKKTVEDRTKKPGILSRLFRKMFRQ